MSSSPCDSIRYLSRAARDRQRPRAPGGTVDPLRAPGRITTHAQAPTLDTPPRAALRDHDRGIRASLRATLRPRLNAETSETAIERPCDAVRSGPSRLDAIANPTRKEMSHAT